MNIAIDSSIYRQAQIYAQSRRQSLSTIVESYLLRLINKNRAKEQETVPDVVLSLLGAGEPVAEDDLNGRQAYSQYMEEKYK